ncbi:uncharacterized protein LOC142418934 [Mycteria americana]|uniref:uncharacterized protein LOC142418934 n=1 Tax=Mycteria americana TaxID=33587 RepID=UPI003F5864A1
MAAAGQPALTGDDARLCAGAGGVTSPRRRARPAPSGGPARRSPAFGWGSGALWGPGPAGVPPASRVEGLGGPRAPGGGRGGGPGLPRPPRGLELSSDAARRVKKKEGGEARPARPWAPDAALSGRALPRCPAAPAGLEPSRPERPGPRGPRQRSVGVALCRAGRSGVGEAGWGTAPRLPSLRVTAPALLLDGRRHGRAVGTRAASRSRANRGGLLGPPPLNSNVTAALLGSRLGGRLPAPLLLRAFCKIAPLPLSLDRARFFPATVIPWVFRKMADVKRPSIALRDSDGHAEILTQHHWRQNERLVLLGSLLLLAPRTSFSACLPAPVAGVGRAFPRARLRSRTSNCPAASVTSPSGRQRCGNGAARSKAEA